MLEKPVIKNLEREDGTIVIEELPNERRLVTVIPKDKKLFMLYDKWETSYPVDLIQLMLEVNGTAGICHEIIRDEDPMCVERLLRNDLFAYFDAAEFRGKQILDFGCGSGASTLILARLFPKSEITGVELLASELTVARKRLEFYNLTNINFLQSPSGTQIPKELGQFDFVILSAVYEHLLPRERRALLPQLWESVRKGGFLFINQTPNRLFPFELHTTMLPLINYLPDRLALLASRRFSKRVTPHQSWEELLRQGIRGATEKEIFRRLPKDDCMPVMLKPTNHGLRDRIDLYYSNTNPNRLRTLKQIAKVWIKAIRAIFGVTLVPDLSLAFQKLPRKP